MLCHEARDSYAVRALRPEEAWKPPAVERVRSARPLYSTTTALAPACTIARPSTQKDNWECPRVTAVTDWRSRLPYCRWSAKPSHVLEPSTACLPFPLPAGKGGHKRVTATTKAPETEGIAAETSDRECTRVPALVFPQCSVGRLGERGA